MSEKDPIRVFVSHVFQESDDYLRVFEYLESVDSFFYVNCSQPDDIPTGNPDAFKEKLLSQIKQAEVVLVLSSLYELKRDWVNYMIEAARAHELPVLAINAFGGTIALDKRLLEACDDVLDWNDRAIVDAIRQHARGEDTQRWEVIDFP